MSYFVFNPPKSGRFHRFLFQINKLGNSVIYELDEQGRPVEFVCGDISETIGSSLKAVHPGLVLVDLREWSVSSPGFWFWRIRDGQRWRDVLAILQGKSCAAKRELLIVMHIYDRFNFPITDWIAGSCWFPEELSLTQKALEADAKADARAAEEERSAKEDRHP